MSKAIHERLANLGVELGEPAASISNYVPVVKCGNTLYVSGQLPLKDGEFIKGQLGKDIALEDAQEAAKYCAISILAQVNAFLDGDLSKIKRCVKLGGFVASTPEFTDQHKVLNGASDFMVAVLGEEIGKHARFAVGVPSQALGVAVEIDAIFEV